MSGTSVEFAGIRVGLESPRTKLGCTGNRRLQLTEMCWSGDVHLTESAGASPATAMAVWCSMQHTVQLSWFGRRVPVQSRQGENPGGLFLRGKLVSSSQAGRLLPRGSVATCSAKADASHLFFPSVGSADSSTTRESLLPPMRRSGIHRASLFRIHLHVQAHPPSLRLPKARPVRLPQQAVPRCRYEPILAQAG